MEKERVEYLDFLKALAIYLVVFCHYVWLPDNSFLGNVMMTLAWGAVPCFFMTTGGLMHMNSTFNVKKHCKKIFIFYIGLIIWKMIYFVCVGGLKIQIPKHLFIQYLFLFGNLDEIPTGSMWFMTALLFVMLFYPISYNVLKSSDGKRIYVYILLISAFFGVIVPSVDYWSGYVEKFITIHIPRLEGIVQISPIGNYAYVLFYFLWGGGTPKIWREIGFYT